jgi:nucleoside-diphosphate-sugar epimerase
MLGELYANYFKNLYDLPIVNARFFNSYGPGEVPGKYRNVIPKFFFWAMNNKQLPITGTGDETRDFTYVGDIVNGLISMAQYERAVGEAINLGTGREIRIGDLAKWISEITGSGLEVVYQNRREWDKKNRLLSSIDKAKSLLNYSPEMNFVDGLKRTHEWFKGNWEDIERSAEF